MGSHTKNTKAKVDWSLQPRGTVHAVATGALGVATTGAIGHIAHLGAGWAAAGAAVGAVGTVLTAAHRNLSTPNILYRMGCLFGAGGWLAEAWAHTPWTPHSFAALAIGAAGAGVCAPLGRRKPGPPESALVPRKGGRIAVEWERRIDRVCRIKVTVTDVSVWDGKCGFDLSVDLPAGGATRKHLARYAENLAADAHLPEGCGVEFAPGRDRGRVIIGVSTVNRLFEDVPYPADYTPRSILDLVEIGEYRDASTVGVELREASVLATGQKGSGKTNLLNVFTLAVGRCRDALVWHIDLNGGGLSQSWLDAWLEGDTDRPPIDWAASNPIEALIMVKVALAVTKDRKTSYRRLKVKADANLLPVSPDLPEIVIVVDEGGEVLAPGARDPIIREIRDGLEELQRIGRNEAVNPVVSSLRATADLVAPNVKKQSAIRIGMFVQDDEELSYLFGWNKGISVDDLPTKGCGFIAYEQRAPRPFKVRLLKPSQVVMASIEIGRMRPELDAPGARIADGEIEIGERTLTGLYSSRYDRMRAAFTGHTPEIHTTPTPALVPAQGNAVVGSDPRTWGDPRDRARKPEPVRVDRENASAWPDPRTLTRQQTPSPATAELEAGHPIPRLLSFALEVFDVQKTTRLHSEELAAELGMSTRALANLMGQIGVDRPANGFVRNGERRRGYERADLLNAVDAIGRGERDVLAEVADWPNG